MTVVWDSFLYLLFVSTFSQAKNYGENVANVEKNLDEQSEKKKSLS